VPPQLAVDDLVVADLADRWGVDVDRHCAPIVLHSVDAVARERERLVRPDLPDPARSVDDEGFVPRSSFEHVDADARAAVIVVAGVARLPPQVQPAFRVLVAPEQLERAVPAAIEGRDIDEPGGGLREIRALFWGELAAGGRERLESLSPGHAFILDRARAVVQHAVMGRIDRVEAWPANARLEAPYLMALGTVPGISRTIVRVTTEDGVAGLGESAWPGDAEVLRGEVGEGLVGRESRDVLDELGRWEPGRVDHRTDGKVVIRNPLSGVEIALWDIAAREAEVPLHVLLGGAVRESVEFSEYFAYRPGSEDSPSDVAAFCARMVEEHGSKVFEGKVAVRPVEEDVRLAGEIRAAIGPDLELRLDANMGWRAQTARRALELLEPLGIANVEEPVASFAEMAELRRGSAIPFSAHTPDVGLAAELGAPDTLVLGLGFFGGIAGTRRFIAACEEAGVGFWFYSGDFGIATAAYLHIAAATPSLGRASQSLLRWTTDDVIAGGPFSPEHGAVPVPAGPGLGVELDENALARCVELYGREGEYDFYTGGPPPRY
jgi:glucarate dehydratase